MTKDELVQIFNEAKEKRKDIALELTVPGRTETEIIIVKRKNLQYKLSYYISAYNDNLELLRCTDIKIINMKMFDLKKVMEVIEND